MPDSDFDFDDFPDPFVGVDWSTVPGLFDVTPAVATGIEGSHRVLTGTDSLGSVRVEDTQDGAATPSSHYSFDDLDVSAFAELDAMEGRLAQDSVLSSLSAAGPSAARAVQDTRTGKATPASMHIPPKNDLDDVSLQTGERVMSSTSPAKPRTKTSAPTTPDRASSPRKRQKMYMGTPSKSPQIKSTKGKEKGSPNIGLRRVLSGFEDEMTCPICCDLLAAVHVGNPCGHSFCGECGWGWIRQNPKKVATCPVCRSQLSTEVPMISNIAMDNTIEKHVQALRESGANGWETGGSQLSDWQKRKEKGKALAAKRVGTAPARKSRTITSDMFEVMYELMGDDPLDADYVDHGSQELVGVDHEEEESESDVEEVVALPQLIRNAAYSRGANPRSNFRPRGQQRGAGGSRRNGRGGGEGYSGAGGSRRGGRGNRGYRGHSGRRR